MPIITRLVQGKKNPNRVNLYLDNQFAFALSIDEVARHNLKKGVELSQNQLDELKSTDQAEYIYVKVLNFISFRPRTVKEVRDRLKKYEVTDIEMQESIITRLKSQGYLNDIAFARWFIESRNTHRPRSVRMLSQELSSKGVGGLDIASVITEISDEKVSIRKIIDKKLGAPRRLEFVEKQKISAYLGRLGYSWEAIRAVVKSWESE